MLQIVKRTLRRAMNDNITGEAAKATYYFFFSLFPLIVASFAITGLVGGERAFTWIMQRVETLAPGEGGEILEGFVTDITMDQRFDALSIGLLLALWAGSNFFAALGEGLDRMFDVRASASFLKRRGKALLMLMIGGALMVAGATAILLGPMLAAQLGLGGVASALRWPLGFVLITALMSLVYYILPNRDQSRIKREIAIGALVATAIWMLATGGFSLYVQNFADYNQTYGAIGAVIILMMWLFITALAVLLGGELIHVLEERRLGGQGRTPESDVRVETPRTPLAPTAGPTASPGNGARKADSRHARRPDHAAAPRLAGSARAAATRPRWGTSLALRESAGDGYADHRQRRQQMADRNEGFGANDPLAPGSGDIRGGAYDRGTDLGGNGDAVHHRGDDIVERGEEMLERGKDRAHDAADTGRSRLAGKLEELGGRLEERGRDAEGRGGVQERAGRAAVRAGHALDESAEYLRTHDVDEMRDDLERQIRDRPLVSVGIALGAGFLLARLLRD